MRHVEFRLAMLVLVGCITASIASDLVTHPVRTFGLGDLQSVAVSIDGRRLATAGRSGVFLWDLEAGTLRQQLPSEGGTNPALAFSPDGAVLLSAGDSRIIRAWDTASGAFIREFAGHKGAILDLEFASDGGAFVSASADNTARVWDFETGETRHQVTVPGAFISAAAFTPDGARLVTAASSLGDRIQLWDLATETLIRTLPVEAWHIAELGFVRSGHMVSAGDDLVVRVWDIESGDLVRELEGSSLSIVGMATSADSRAVLVGCGDGRVLAWDSETGAVMGHVQGDYLIGFCGIPGVGWAVTAGADNRVRLVDLTSEETLQTLQGHTTSSILDVSFSPDGRYVLSGGVESATRLWNRANGDLIRTFEGHGSGTVTATFSADGTRLFTTRGHPQPMVQIWKTETGELERELGWTQGWPTCVAVSSETGRVLAGDENGKVRLWDLGSTGNPRTFTGRAAMITSVAISPDGRRIASGGSSYRPAVNVWDTMTGESIHVFELEAGSVTALAFSPSGQELLVGWEDGYLRIMDVETGAIEREIVTPAAYLNDAVYSPDGRHILIGEGWPTYTGRLYDTSTGKMLRTFAGHRWSVESVAFDVAGTAVLTGSDSVRLWDIRDVAARIRVERLASGLELHWERGILERAIDPGGPWRPLTEAVSPWTLTSDGSMGLFRVKVLEP
jgi:WD40 repeat protein